MSLAATIDRLAIATAQTWILCEAALAQIGKKHMFLQARASVKHLTKSLDENG